jgi:hypothetical protein
MKKSALTSLAACASLAINTALAVATVTPDTALTEVRAKAQAISQAGPDLRNKIALEDRTSLTVLGLADPWSLAPNLQANDHGDEQACTVSCCCSKSC